MKNSILPADNSTVLKPENFKLGFTQSEITTFDDCGEKWYYGYNHMLRKRGAFEWYFVYGDALHKTLSNWYRTGQLEVATLQFPDDVFLDNDQETLRDRWQQVLQVQMERYAAYYADDLTEMNIRENEVVFTVKHEGITFAGKIDLSYTLRTEPDLWLNDHKSTGRLDATATLGWDYRFQFMFYAWLYEKLTGERVDKFSINGIKKPGLKQGEHESVQAYVSRVRQDMIQRPTEYFKRIPLALMYSSMEHFETRVLAPKLERLRLLTQATTPANIIESLVRNQNTNNCVKYGKACQFMPICQHGFKREHMGYVVREHKHEELEAE